MLIFGKQVIVITTVDTVPGYVTGCVLVVPFFFSLPAPVVVSNIPNEVLTPRFQVLRTTSLRSGTKLKFQGNMYVLA
jgi:hypothetical protein